MRDRCFICGSEYSDSKIKGIIRCASCGLNTCASSISDEQLKEIYSEGYFQGEEYCDYLADKKIIQMDFNQRLKTLLSFISDSRKKKLFEIGCAYGFFLELARDKFESVCGIDISAVAIEYAREVLKLDTVLGDFLSWTVDSTYDVFCLWDTIEHLRQPHLFIEKISQHVAPDGIVAITTSDVESLNARIRGARWRQIHFPTHLHYFSANSLRLLLEHNGFEVIYQGYPGKRFSIESIAYATLVRKIRKPGIYNRLKDKRLLDWHIYLNLGDLLYCIARKK